MSAVSLRFAALVMLLPLAACSALNGQPGQKSPMELQLEAQQTRLDEVERRMQTQNQVNMFTDLQALQVRERELRGELERVNFELQQLRAQQKNLYVDLDGRLSSLEGGSAGSRSTAVVATDNAKLQYDQAFELLKKGRYDQANVGFTQFLTQQADHELAPNAQYWLGESHYVAQAFDKASTAFEAVLDKYPDSKKARDAMLKLGYTRLAQGRKDDARQLLQKVVTDYRGTTQAKLAQQKLDSL